MIVIQCCGFVVRVSRPLHCAVAGNHVTIVRELLRCGADVTKQNGAKRSVLQLAKGRAVRQLIHGQSVICKTTLLHIKRIAELLMKLYLRAVGCHLPYEITQYYLPPDTSAHIPP